MHPPLLPPLPFRFLRRIRAPRPRRGTLLLVQPDGLRLTAAGEAALRELECEMAGNIPGNATRWETLMAVLAAEESAPTDGDAA